VLAAPIPTAAAEIKAAQHLAAVPLTVSTAHGARHYRVEVARTAEQQEIGLMFRKSMALNHGMIFPRRSPDIASFWMENTLIPLDLIFIRADGTISSITANAPPLSRDIIASSEPIAAVLELAGGEAKHSGIRPGDRVHW
ncbi:MAG: hypothetical protein JWR77_1874, partial [Rhizorhabdus sp.]|nr:hypothetical protein [Rhizorhabdus sp.]